MFYGEFFRSNIEVKAGDMSLIRKCYRLIEFIA